MKEVRRLMAIMRPDGNTYDAYGMFLCKTHPSQIRPQRTSLLWTLEVAKAEARRKKPESRGCIGRELSDL